MQKNIENKSSQARSALSFQYVTKLSAISLLLLLSILITACGPSTTTGANTANNDPTPTATINLNNPNASPTPALPADWCGIWVTNPSPSISTGMMNIYGKFTQNENGNPVGITNASVTFSIQWGDGIPESETRFTNTSGIVTLSANLGMHGGAINKLSLITADFSSGNTTCKVGSDRPASFVVTAGTRSPGKTGGNGGNTGGGNTGGGGGNPRKHG